LSPVYSSSIQQWLTFRLILGIESSLLSEPLLSATFTLEYYVVGLGLYHHYPPQSLEIRPTSWQDLLSTALSC
jgi:hypothetical protein